MTKSLITSAIHGQPVFVKCDELTEGAELLVLPLTAPALERMQADLGICTLCGGRHRVEEGGRTIKCYKCGGKSPSFADLATRAKALGILVKGWSGLVEVDAKDETVERPFEYTDENVALLAARVDIFNLVFELATTMGGLRKAGQEGN